MSGGTASALRPVQQERLSRLSYAALLRALLRLEFAPGEQLNLGVLSRQLGVSQTPLKEAVRFLADQGLLEIRPRQGTFVKPITEQLLGEAIEARLLIETWAFDLVESRASRADWEAIEENLAATHALLGEAVGAVGEIQERFIDLDYDFHLGVVRTCRNRPVVRVYESIGTTFQLARAWALERPEALLERMTESLSEHRTAYEHARAGRRAEAVGSIRQHIERSFRRAVSVIRRHGGAI